KLATAHCFAFSFHRRHLLWSCWRCLPLFGQREGIRLYFDKHLAEHSYSPIKIGGLGAFEIGEEALDPRLEVLLEQLAISPCRRREPAADKSGHDLAEDRSVILGFGFAGNTFDAKFAQVCAQTRERPLVQKSGEIIGGIGQKFPAPEADEEIEVFAPDSLDIGPAGGLGKRRMSQSDRRGIAAQRGELFEQSRVGSPCGPG